MERFLFFRIVFCIAMLVSTLVLGLIFLMIKKVGAKTISLKADRDKYSELHDILPEQDGSLDKLTA